MTEKPEVGVTGRKIVYDKDGKPCRTCNTLLDFQLATGKKDGSAKAITGATGLGSTKSQTKELSEVPPDVEQLGRSSWTLLHSIAAQYPEKPASKQQQDLKQFLKLFGTFYPCWHCADDFKGYLTRNEPKVESQDDFGKWLCDAHNDVNIKLGKPKFDCDLWKKRWIG